MFCINVVEYAAREAMNASSQALPRDVDEFAHTGVTPAECETIDCVRVADAPAVLECKLTRIVDLPGPSNQMVLGQVTGIHLRDNCLIDGRFDVTTYQPLARLGYRDFTHARDLFEMIRPDD